MNGVIKTVRSDRSRQLLAKASRLIKDYTAILIAEDGRVGSGVFVNTCGLDGILTAHHVAEMIFNSREFALCIAQQEHGVWRRSENFQHIMVGNSTGNPEPRNGPDLSFIVIRDSNLLEILRSLKSFCFLESQRTVFFDSPLPVMSVGGGGTPISFAGPDKARGKGGPLAKKKNWWGGATFFPEGAGG